MYAVLLGPPGAGKGTQAKAIADHLGVRHVSSGDLFREALSQGTELGLKAKSYMERGALVPDEVTIAMVMERLSRHDYAGGAVLDGFPRTEEQAVALDKALRADAKQVDKVLLIDVPAEELYRRLTGRRVCRNCGEPFHIWSKPPTKDGVCDLCGGELYQRADDTLETAKERLQVYETQTEPLINYYSRAGKLVKVDGAQGIATVQKLLIGALG